MAKKNANNKIGFGLDVNTPLDAIHLGEGKRIRLESPPLASSDGDKQVGNRRYNDLRYMLQSDDPSGARVTNYELIITSAIAGIASVNWIDSDLDINNVTDQPVVFPGLPSTGNFRIDLLQAKNDGTVNIKPGDEDDILGVTAPAPDADAIGVTTILWNDAGESQQPGNPNPSNDDFSNKRFGTLAAPNTTGKYAKVWEGKLSSTDNYGIIIDYQDTINAVDFNGAGAGRVQLSWTASTARNIIPETIQFETVNTKSADGDFVLVQIAGNKAALFHKASHYWSRIQFRVTFNNSAVKKADFVNNGPYGALPAGTSFASEAFSGEGIPGADGADGREVEIQNSGTAIQWRYVGEAGWTDIVTIAAITGPAGNDGAPGADGSDGTPVELQVSGTMLQWRYVGAPTWTDLFDLSTLGGGGYPDDYTPQTGTAIAFDGPNKYGFNGTALTGNLTFSVTGAKETIMIKALHNSGTIPSVTPPGGVTAILEGGEYIVSVDNILYAICHKNNAGTVTKISYSWTQNQV